MAWNKPTCERRDIADLTSILESELPVYGPSLAPTRAGLVEDSALFALVLVSIG